VPKTARTTKRRRAIRGVGGRVYSRALKPIVLLRRFVDNDDALASFDASHLCLGWEGESDTCELWWWWMHVQVHGVASE